MRKPDAELVLPSDSAVWAVATGLQLPGNVAALLVQCLGALALSGRDVLRTSGERDRAYPQLGQFLRRWAHTMDRRDVLRVLGWAATTVLNTVLAQRDLARVLVPECPAALRSRMLSALSEASRQAGWLSFDLQQFGHAGYYYEDARALAHEAENVGLGAFVLCEMSHLATWQGRSRIGIDHAVAAGQWAHRTDDMRLRAYTADVAARAYAADGQRGACMTIEAGPRRVAALEGDHGRPPTRRSLSVLRCGMKRQFLITTA